MTLTIILIMFKYILELKKLKSNEKYSKFNYAFYTKYYKMNLLKLSSNKM